MKSLLIAGVVVSVLAVAGLWMGVRRVQAQTGAPVLYPVGPQALTLGMVGLAPGQTARLNALNLPGCCAPAERPTQILSVPCNMTLSFMDDQGATLKTATMNIDSGKAVHLDLARDEVNGDSPSSRVQIRGVIVQVVTPPVPPVTAGVPIPFPFGCSVAPTLEIFDSATGKTTAVLASASGVPTILPLLPGAPAARQ
jgi:hypothetical protein